MLVVNHNGFRSYVSLDLHLLHALRLVATIPTSRADRHMKTPIDFDPQTPRLDIPALKFSPRLSLLFLMRKNSTGYLVNLARLQ